MVISKTAEANNGGTYTITLEAYATGDKIITGTKKDIPTDIILVLDQSGSMADPMSSERAYSAYENSSNSYLRGERFNGGDDNLYYPLDGGYVEVQVDRQYVMAMSHSIPIRQITPIMTAKTATTCTSKMQMESIRK